MIKKTTQTRKNIVFFLFLFYHQPFEFSKNFRLLLFYIKGIQCLTDYFDVEFTDTILDIVVFVKKKCTCFLSFWNKKISLGLWKIRCGSTRSLSWLCEESVMALPGVCHSSEISPLKGVNLWTIWHGSWRNPSPVETGLSFYWQFSTLTIFSQSPDKLLAEPWQTPGRAMTFFFKSKGLFYIKRWKLSQNIFGRKQ